MKKVALILHDIRSLHNVGSAFRTADAAGVDTIYLTGYTPSPIDRFHRPVQEIAKVALGAEKIISWKKCSIEECFTELKKDEYQIVAVEQHESSIDYKDVEIIYPVAFIFGNEVGGVPEEIIQQVDVVAEIPMHGDKESLNVSVALGVALFRMLGK